MSAIKISRAGLTERLKKKIPDKITLHVGLFDSEMATVGGYQEFGWVQRVTPKQSYFLQKSFGVNVMPNYTLSSPPRPFLRATMRAKSKEWKNMLSREVKSKGIGNIVSIAETLARQMQTDVKETISNNGTGLEKFPERSPLTLAIYAAQGAMTARGNKRQIESASGSARSQALVKSGKLLGSIKYEVKHERS